MNKRENGENDVLSNTNNTKDAETGRCERILTKKWKLISKFCIILLVLAVVLLIVGVVYVSIGLLAKKKTRDFRLPKSVVPTHYTLEIQPFLVPDVLKFKGSVEINFHCKERTDEVVLHAKNLSIDHWSVRIRNEKGKDVEVFKIDYEPVVDLVILKLTDKLSVDNYILFMSFVGNLDRSSSLTGFYSYTYEDEDNNMYYAAATQFEPIHAREAFPCFDEPELKATFDITVVRWRNMTSISNMPKVVTESRGRHWEADIFNTSKKMSTYLVAFVVGDFKSKKSGKVSLWASPKNIEYVDYALEVAEEALKFFEVLLGVPYDVPKLDIVSIEELMSRGMENWGLIICRQNILYNEETDYSFKKEDVTRIIIHEIAHQWFGNLVTMKWWNDIWLNEGTTKFMEEIAFEALHVVLNVTNEKVYPFSYENFLYINSPVSKNIKSLEQIEDVFDYSTYFMGASIMRLARFVLGDEIFWKGLINYLKDNAYGSVEESTLWKYFTDAQPPMDRSRLNISKIFTSWTHLTGYPILSVERDYEKRSANISQIAFQEEVRGMKNHTWPIPITYTTAKDLDWRPTIKMWTYKKQEIITNITGNRDDWIIVNGENVVYYVVNYDETNWNLLAKQLRENHSVIPATHRKKVLTDAGSLFEKNLTTLNTLLDLYLYFPFEDEYYAIMNSKFLVMLFEISRLIELTPDEIMWDNYIIYLFESPYKKFGWEYGDKNENDYNRGIRELSIFFLCRRRYMPCVNTAIAKFKNWNETKNETGLDHNIKHSIMCTGIEYGTAEEWNEVFNSYLENEDFLSTASLACSRNRTLITKLLEELLKKPKVRRFLQILKEVLRNPHMWLEVFHFFNVHFKELAEDDSKFENILMAFDDLKDSPLKFKQVIATGRQYMKLLSKEKAKKYKMLLDVDDEMNKKNEWMKNSVHKWLQSKQWKKVRRP
ncbi:endoplasmic reticulum aminopeptidase 1-like [Centruroides vittatus]|uniref:endoplasmic reticulum aminopeptidase 1-like n=1 Tax=Centruroides vittatus TaxID=120091 RepID=UPI003510A182